MANAKFLEDKLRRLETDLRALADDAVVDPIISFLRSQPTESQAADDALCRMRVFINKPIEIGEVQRYRALQRKAKRDRRPVARSSELYAEIARLNGEIIQLKRIVGRQAEELRKLRRQ